MKTVEISTPYHWPGSTRGGARTFIRLLVNDDYEPPPEPVWRDPDVPNIDTEFWDWPEDVSYASEVRRAFII